MRYESPITVTVEKTGRTYNFVGRDKQLDPFITLGDALAWADYIGFTHYQLNGKRCRIPPQYRLVA